MWFSTLAKPIAVYECSLEDLLEVERVSATGPLYLGALAAFAEGTLQVKTWTPSEPLYPRRRRSPVGTVHQ